MDSVGEFLIVALVGFGGGAINAVVGSGTLLTYPVLLSVGLSPTVANGTNTTGLSVGGLAAAFAYRAELRHRLRVLALPVLLAITGGAVGALLVVRLPEKVFVTVVPWLIIAAVALVIAQPFIARAMRLRPHHVVRPGKDLPFWGLLVGTYAGYFGAAQGVMYMAILGLRYDEDVQHANAAKNVLGPTANLAAAIVFIASGFMSWPYAIAIIAGSILGGYYGGRGARHIPAPVLRGIIAAVGLYAAVYLFVSR